MAFATIGFEHSVANMMMIPLQLMHGAHGSFGRFIGSNLIPVTIGNFIGGFLMTGSYYYFSYLWQDDLKVRKAKKEEEEKKKKELELAAVVPTAPTDAGLVIQMPTVPATEPVVPAPVTEPTVKAEPIATPAKV